MSVPSEFTMADRDLALPSLSMRDRVPLFHAIRHGIGPPMPDVTTATFGGTRGVIVAGYPLARRILVSTVGVKSRPVRSQRELGGVGALRDDQVRAAKADLLIALGREAADIDSVRRHLELGFARTGTTETALGALTEALSGALLAQLLGTRADLDPSFALREAVFATWLRVESAVAEQDSLPGEPNVLDDHLSRTVAAHSSRFVETLRLRGWADERIVAEIRGMLLAGWGSTSASILSTLALGAAESAAQPAVQDEVLRLYPPSFMIARRVVEPIPGIPIDIGDIVLISPWLIHRNPAGWSAPDRFLPARRCRDGSGPEWFLPFGIGARRCPAARFARTQAAQACALLKSTPTPDDTVVRLIENRSPALVGQSWDTAR
ncbi:cytochrome P450 [Nocardia takedensis]